jgi:hypothetical protein
MAINFAQPSTTRNYSTEFTQDIQNNIIAIAQWLDSTQTTITGTVPTYAKRINRTTNLIEEYNGSSWATYPLGYVAKTGDTMSGALTISATATLGLVVSRASGNTSGIQIAQTSVVSWNIQNIATTGDLSFNVGASDLVKLSVNGNLTINAPSSGSHTFNGTINFGTRPVFNGNTPFDTANWTTYVDHFMGLGAGSTYIKTGRNIWYTGAYSYSSLSDANAPTTYGATIGFGQGTSGSGEVFVGWISAGAGMWYRGLRDTTDNWWSWTRLLDTANYTSTITTLTSLSSVTCSAPLKGNSGSKGWGAITTTTTTGTPTGGASGDFYFVY